MTDKKASPGFEDGAVALARIEVLVGRARAVWLVLLGFLAFVGLTLFSVRDLDFFSISSTTQLPIINIDIPTKDLFWTASLLAAVLHSYFHVFLLKLWDALGEAPPVIDGGRLGDRVVPWLVIDWALRRRRDQPITRRPLDGLGSWVIGIIVWLAAPIALAGFWWRSLVAHDARLSLVIAAALWLCLYVSFQSFWRARKRLRDVGLPGEDDGPKGFGDWLRASLADLAVSFRRYGFFGLGLVLLLATLAGAGTHHLWREVEVSLNALWPSKDRQMWLAQADLNEAEIAKRPEDWRDYHVAKERFFRNRCSEYELSPLVCFWSDDGHHQKARLDWCDERGLNEAACADRFTDLIQQFEEAWRIERRAYLANITGPDLQGLDLRGASMAGAFLAGSRASWAKLAEANFNSAWLEGANFYAADLGNASFDRAHLEGVSFWGANLTQAFFYAANLSSGRLQDARMQGVFLLSANLELTDLRFAKLNEAELSMASFEGAELARAELNGARAVDARFDFASFGGAKFRFVDLERASFRYSIAKDTDFTGAMGLTQEQLATMIGDDRTRLPEDEDGRQLHVWSCWPDGDQHRRTAALMASNNFNLLTVNITAKEWLNRFYEWGWICPKGSEPQRVGRTEYGVRIQDMNVAP